MGKAPGAILLFVIFLVLCDVVNGLFQFKRYTYRKKSGNERRYRLQEERCHSVEDCKNKVGLNKETCMRMCISRSCYNELYSWNEVKIRHCPAKNSNGTPRKAVKRRIKANGVEDSHVGGSFRLMIDLGKNLEEGEIDVRLSSFKGCVVQQIREKELEQRRNDQL